jgi:hypothetical protein
LGDALEEPAAHAVQYGTEVCLMLGALVR